MVFHTMSVDCRNRFLGYDTDDALSNQLDILVVPVPEPVLDVWVGTVRGNVSENQPRWKRCVRVGEVSAE